MEVSKSIFKRQADFLEKNGKYLLQFTPYNNNFIKKLKIISFYSIILRHQNK